MKNLIFIRVFSLLGSALSLTLFFSSCSMFKESPQEKTNIVTIDAKTGESTLHKETSYVSKGESLQIEVNNYNPMMDSIVFNKLERNINSNGGDFSDITTPVKDETFASNTNLKKIRDNTLNEIKEEENEKDKKEQSLAPFDDTNLKKLREKEKFLNAIKNTNDEVQNILYRLSLVSTQEELNELVFEMNQLKTNFRSSISSFTEDGSKEIEIDLSETIRETKNQLSKTMQMINSISFKKFLPFEAKKEETEIEVSIYKKSTKQLVCSYNHTFITKNHFKMSGSVGAHVIITDGSVNNAFKNVDSLIVSRRISNIQPSFGTYMNGTWRVNDALVGFGLGLGVPVDGQDNLSPNFSVFFTSLFQTEYGRFGFNVGAAIRQTRILSPGYELGINLGNASIDVPTISTWKPGLMFGISYVIGGKEK